MFKRGSDEFHKNETGSGLVSHFNDPAACFGFSLSSSPYCIIHPDMTAAEIRAIDTIYVIHHTHTDVGFTNYQPVFGEMQYRSVPGENAEFFNFRAFCIPCDEIYCWRIP
jgi:hypothetical protein